MRKANGVPLVIAAIIVFLAAGPLPAATWFVDAGGGGSATTIAGGLALASYGDSVIVNPGTYFENLTMKNGVVLRSRDGAAFTTIDGSNLDPIFLCQAVDATTAIEGFTLTHALGDSVGGAIVCLAASSPRIAENIIAFNRSRYGAAVGCANHSSPLVENNEITDNIATQECGGVLGIFHCDLIVRNNVFRRNVSETASGGAMWFGDQCRVTVTGNFVADNHCADGGGGIWLGNSGSSSSRVDHNVFVRNRCGIHGGAIYGGAVSVTIESNTIVDCSAVTEGGGIWIWTGASIMIRNIVTGCTAGAIGTEGACIEGCNDLYGNPDGDYCGFLTPGADDIHLDADFCGAAIDDYRLSAASPCLHAACGVMGALGQGCGSTPTEATTWGAVKARFE